MWSCVPGPGWGGVLVGVSTWRPPLFYILVVVELHRPALRSISTHVAQRNRSARQCTSVNSEERGLAQHVAAAVRMPRPARTTLPETPHIALDDLISMNAAEARQQLQVFEALPSTSLHGLLLNGKIDGAPGHSAGLFSTAMRLYPENRVPLDMALKLLRLLDDVSMRSVWLGSTGDSTVLMDACRMVPHDAELVELLLAAGADATLNVPSSEGYTALMLASRLDFTAAVRLLVDYQADVNRLDAYGHSALHHACETGATVPAMVLVAADATIHPTALCTCASSAARVASVCALGLLLGAMVLIWLAQRAHQICPSLGLPRPKKPRRRRGTRTEAAAPSIRPPSRDFRVKNLYARPKLRAVGLILAVAVVMPSLLYQQSQIQRSLETHVHEMPAVPWELIALAEVCRCLSLSLCPFFSPSP